MAEEKNGRMIRVRVPSYAYDALQKEATANGETLAALLRRLIIKRVNKSK